MTDVHEPVDLGAAGAFDELIRTSEAIPAGEVWVGPGESDPVRAFGPGTTDGGRAEAGWFMIGTVAEDGLHFGDPSRKPGDLSAGPIPTTNGIQR